MAAEVEEWHCLLSLDGMAPGQVDRPHYMLSKYMYFSGLFITFQLSKIITYFHMARPLFPPPSSSDSPLMVALWGKYY